MRTMRTFGLLPIVLMASLAFNACFLSSKEGIEKANTKVVTAVQAARKITTSQHDFGMLEDAGYVKRLQGFRNVYVASDRFAELFVKYDTIDTSNKAEFVTAAQYFVDTLGGLIADGTIGVKNDKSQADFLRYLNVAYATLSSAKVAIAALSKPVDVSNVKVTKMTIE